MIVLKKELKEKESVLAFFIEVAISQSSPPFIQKSTANLHTIF